MLPVCLGPASNDLFLGIVPSWCGQGWGSPPLPPNLRGTGNLAAAVEAACDPAHGLCGVGGRGMLSRSWGRTPLDSTSVFPSSHVLPVAQVPVTSKP